MAIFPPASMSARAPAVALASVQKRKADALEDEPHNVTTLTVKPGSVGGITAPGPQGAACQGAAGPSSIQLSKFGGAAKVAKIAQDEEGAPLAFEIAGFRQSGLNGRYTVRMGVVAHGRRTYWTQASTQAPSRFFLAWQASMNRWAIAEHFGDSSDAQVPEIEELMICQWRAFQRDQLTLLESSRWMERMDAGWARPDSVQVTAVPPGPLAAARPNSVSEKERNPAAVDISGFRRLELNARYTPRADCILQGKPTYWDASGRFFIYWQQTLRRWAICGKRALDVVKSGQCPGCACQLDQQTHFALPCRWAELQQSGWVTVPLEIKAHQAPQDEDFQSFDDAGASGAQSSAELQLGGTDLGERIAAAAFVKAALEKTQV